MRKFAEAITENWDIEISDQRMEKLIKSPQFQEAICTLLQSIEAEEHSQCRKG
jgi:hypothetical protein